jgi:hypothetical protein
MEIDSVVHMAMAMKYQSAREGASMRVAKMALERMEQTGRDVGELLGAADAPLSLDPDLGNLLDISI